MERPSIDITPLERLGRIAVGVVGAIAGLVLLGSAGSPMLVVLEVLLVLAGLDLLITGALGTARSTTSSATPLDRSGGTHELAT